jgi:hypothetical protein
VTADERKAVLAALHAFEEIEAICLGHRDANTSAVMTQSRRGALALHSLINSGTVYPEQNKIPA